MTRNEIDAAITAHYKMAISVSRGFYARNKDMDISELEGVALSILCEAVNRYRPSGLTVGKYAKNYIEYGLLDYIKKERQRKFKTGTEFDEESEHCGPSSDYNELFHINNIDAKNILNTLDEERRALFIEFLSGKTLREIASDNLISYPTVYRRIKSIINELKQ